MKSYRITIKPAGPFGTLPASETLFGGVCWGIRALFGVNSLEEMLGNFHEHSWGFVVSSAFPECPRGVRYYPRPLTRRLSGGDLEEIAAWAVRNRGGASLKSRMLQVVSLYKEFKRCPYVSEELFETMLHGEPEARIFMGFLEGLGEVKGSGCRPVYSLNGMTLGYEEVREGAPLWKSALAQRNTVGRATMSTGVSGEIHYSEVIVPREGLFLYFWAMTRDIDAFVSALRYLEDRGLGGDRSVGRGQFVLEEVEEGSIPGGPGRRFVLLSKLLPAPGEILWDEPSSYDLIPCRSKVESLAEFAGEDIWKARVLYVKEGSVLTAAERKPFYGSLPVVKTVGGKRIVQNGLGLAAFGEVAV